MKKKVSIIWATVFGVGFLPYAPGTWGSIVAFFAWFLFFKELSVFSYLILIIILSLLSIYFCNEFERIYKVKDSQYIVVDEFCGYLLGMFMVPTGIFWGLAGLVLFRIFDIWKPVPIRKFEKLPSGLGVMADDLFAGVYVALILNLVVYFISYL